MKNILVALSISQLVAGCVATTYELEAVKSGVSFDQKETRAFQAGLERRMSAMENNLQRLDKASMAKPRHEEVGKRIAAIEAQLQKIEKGSALAVQMGLISSVHADSNDKGIAGVRTELDKLTAEIQALEARLLESDKQLETGLTRLKDLSGRLK